MGIYFLETDFEKGTKITWFTNKKRGFGTVLSENTENIEIKDENGSVLNIPKPYANKIHPLHSTIIQLEENIKKNEKNLFQKIDPKDLSHLENYLNTQKKEIIDELFPYREQGFRTSFIFDETIHEDDTNETVLMKISQRCSSCIYESKKYIYAAFLDYNTNTFQPIGFNYENINILSPEDLLTNDACTILEQEKDFTDDYDNNIIDTNDSLFTLFENNKIKDNTIFFLSLNDFIESKDIDADIINHNIDCEDIQYDLKIFKNRIINKYWPQLSKLDHANIFGENELKKNEYEIETIKLRNYSHGNKFIYGGFLSNVNKPTITCDNIEIDYFKINKKAASKNNVNLYQLFADFTLSQDVPFMKWIGSSYDNKYFKIFKESMIYEGYDLYRDENKTIDINLCQEWSKDFYRSETKVLEDLNRYDNLHKTDVLLFKVCLKNQFIYSTLVIHLNGDIEMIIKRSNNDILSIDSKEKI
tara:strand:- start:21 stop:1442 length:1422 start_codon:yes stop_codon:yes gene_type:complete